METAVQAGPQRRVGADAVDVVHHQRHAGRQVLAPSGRQVVEHGHAVAVAVQGRDGRHDGGHRFVLPDPRPLVRAASGHPGQRAVDVGEPGRGSAGGRDVLLADVRP
jgi:hypothetical protein